MKLSTPQLAAALFAAVVHSQGADCTSLAISLIPSCARPCFINAAPTLGCAALDFACQCHQQAALHAAVESCVASSCSPSDQQNVLDGIDTVCKCVDGGSSSSSSSSDNISSSTCSEIVSETGAPAPAPSTSAPHPSATPPPATTTAKSAPGGGGGTSPTRSAAPTSTAGPVTGAADRQSRSGLGIVVSVCAAAIAMVVL